MPIQFFLVSWTSRARLAFVLTVVLLSACGGSGPHLMLEDQGQIANGEQAGQGGGAGEEPSEQEGGPAAYTFGYFEDIQPIFEQRCSLCHPGATPDNWTVYEEASAKSGQIAQRVGNLSMPPGNATQMTDEEREMVLIWVEEGAPRGE